MSGSDKGRREVIDPRFYIDQCYNMSVDERGIWLEVKIPGNGLREQITSSLGQYPGDQASLFATFAKKLLSIERLIKGGNADERDTTTAGREA